MLPYLTSLYLIPLVVSILILVLPRKASRVLIIAAALLLSGISIYLNIYSTGTTYYGIPVYVNDLVAAADAVLAFYFLWVGIRRRHVLIWIASVIQLGALAWLLSHRGHTDGYQLMTDRLSMFMFVLVNMISGIIAIFATRYISAEGCSEFRKRYFLALLYCFTAIMNLLVSSNDLEYFFLFFELTTLCSFLFIGFRRDKESSPNALTALWMNQVGGLAVLAALFFIGQGGKAEASFSSLLDSKDTNGLLLPVALLAVAAMVKGAQLPFSRWLLGAMVAPAPVSALLHSSTMVKIAPFIILRLSPLIKDTPVSAVIMVFTGFVFVASAVQALSQVSFKRILAHSTIALLAVMMMMASVGTGPAIIASLILVFFHGLSKCLLFLNAGVMEQLFHVKQTTEMDRIAETGPFTSLMVLTGFLSLLLPPFGVFTGKWLSMETLGTASAMQQVPAVLALVSLAAGGAVLCLLYFKVMGLFIARSGREDRVRFERTGAVFSGTILALALLLVAGMLLLPVLVPGYLAPVATAVLQAPVAAITEGLTVSLGNVHLSFTPLLVAVILLPATVLAAMFIRFRKVDRVKEYSCGEKVNYSFSTFTFSTARATPYLLVTGILFLVALVLAALI